MFIPPISTDGRSIAPEITSYPGGELSEPLALVRGASLDSSLDSPALERYHGQGQDDAGQRARRHGQEIFGHSWSPSASWSSANSDGLDLNVITCVSGSYPVTITTAPLTMKWSPAAGLGVSDSAGANVIDPA